MAEQHRRASDRASPTTQRFQPPSSTAITARYRCSTPDNATNANPGLPAAKSAREMICAWYQAA
jgi:hypothetical protein